jgi:hypothetical protein
MVDPGHEPSNEPSPPSPTEEADEPSSHSNEQAWTAAIIGMVLLVAAYSMSETPQPVNTPERRPAAAVQMITPEAVPLVTGDEAIPELFTRAGCPVCHTIPGIQGTAGRVGPMLLVGTTGPRRLADPQYHGQAKTVHEYVVESIMSPGVYVVSGYPDRTMPTWYGQKLSAAALEKMAVYLEQVTDEDALPSR